MKSYTHAILAGDGVSMLRIVDKCHVDSNQRCPVCCQYLTSNYRHQARDRDRETETERETQIERDSEIERERGA